MFYSAWRQKRLVNCKMCPFGSFIHVLFSPQIWFLFISHASSPYLTKYAPVKSITKRKSAICGEKSCLYFLHSKWMFANSLILHLKYKIKLTSNVPKTSKQISIRVIRYPSLLTTLNILTVSIQFCIINHIHY